MGWYLYAALHKLLNRNAAQNNDKKRASRLKLAMLHEMRSSYNLNTERRLNSRRHGINLGGGRGGVRGREHTPASQDVTLFLHFHKSGGTTVRCPPPPTLHSEILLYWTPAFVLWE